MLTIPWPNYQVASFEEDCRSVDAFVERLQAAGPVPEIPPPVWDRRPIDPAACEAATHALCG